MAVLSILGSAGLTRVSRKHKWNRERGLHYREVWKGPIELVRSTFFGLVGSDLIDDIDMDGDDGVGTLTKIIADQSGDEGDGASQSSELNAVWTVISQDLYRNIRANQTFNVAADQTKLEATRRFFEEAKGGDGPYHADGAPFTTYLDLLRRGSDEFVRTAVIIQKSIPVGKRSTLTASWTGVDRAWKLRNEAGSPNPPSELIGLVENMPEGDNTKKQWLKRGPQLQQLTRYTYSLVYQWWFARRWSNTFYSGDSETDNP